MKITTNLLIEWQATGPDNVTRVERILWAGPSAQEVIVIDIFNRTALPQLRSYDEVERALIVGTAGILSTESRGVSNVL